MPRIFYPSTIAVIKLVLLVIAVSLVIIGIIIYSGTISPYYSQQNIARVQPVPFSHKHHVQGAGIDCRYCHTSVETSATAGMPSTKTCMTCHSQLFAKSPALQPIRDSFEKNIPVAWNRVQNLADFVYFNHGIHIQKGIGCTSCHGHIEEMALVREVKPFFMKNCLVCHEQPEKFLRPKTEVFNMKWKAPADQEKRGLELVKQNKLNKPLMMNCSTCHR